MSLVIGKLYLITSVHSRGLVSKGNNYNYNVMIGVLRHNDIVLILDKDCGDCRSLKVLTSDGIIGHTSAYESDTWQLIGTV